MRQLQNTEYVLANMGTLGYSDQAIESVRDNLAHGQEHFKAFDYKIAEGALTVFEADMNVGKHLLFYNGFQGTQIPNFTNYADKGVDTEELVRQILNPPKMGSDSEQTHAYLADVTDQMTALRGIDHRLFHDIGGVLRPMLLGIDANTNRKFMSADSQLHRRNWFPAREHITLDNATYLLMGRSVKVLTKPDPNFSEQTQKGRKNLPQSTAEREPRIVEPFYWREIDFSKQITNERAVDQPPKYKLSKYDSNWGYDAAKKFTDFRFPGLAEPQELAKAVGLIESGKEYIAQTEDPKHTTVVVMAHASRRTMYLFSNDETRQPLYHHLFRTPQAQQAHDKKSEAFYSRLTSEGQNPQIGLEEVHHKPGISPVAGQQPTVPAGADSATLTEQPPAVVQQPASQGQPAPPPASDPGLQQEQTTVPLQKPPAGGADTSKISNRNKSSVAKGGKNHKSVNRSIQPSRAISDSPDKDKRIKPGQ